MAPWPMTGDCSLWFGQTYLVLPPGYDGPVPEGGYLIQTVPSEGWFTILRLYSPLEPFFDKSWRPSEIEPVP
jgi:hypothetical protein